MVVTETEPRESGSQYHPLSIGEVFDHSSFRFRDISRDPVFRGIFEELGEEAFLALIHRGAQELAERSRLHRYLYDKINGATSRVRHDVWVVFHPESRLGAAYRPFFLSDSHFRTNPHEGLVLGSDRDLWQTELDQKVTFAEGLAQTMRRATLVKALTLLDIRTQAMTAREREMLLENDVDFFRGQTWKSEFAAIFTRELREHYGLEHDGESVVHLFGKGVQAPKHALLSLFSSFPRARYGVFGTLYFETQRFIDRLPKMGFTVPEIQYLPDPDPTRITRWMEEAAQEGLPTVVVTDPIESYDGHTTNINKIMRVNDLELMLSCAAAKYHGDVPCFFVLDTTNTGGALRFAKMREAIRGSSVNLILVQSDYKFFEYGGDTTPLGSEICCGPAFAATGEGTLREQTISVLNLFNLDPDLASFALMPPIDGVYLEFRAKRIARNSLVLLDGIKDHFDRGEIEFSYTGIREEDRAKVNFIGYPGPYFFLEFPSVATAATFADVVANKQGMNIGYLEAGTSFGYDATRIQWFSETPIVRVATGTEDICLTHLVGYNLRRMIAEAIKS